MHTPLYLFGRLALTTALLMFSAWLPVHSQPLSAPSTAASTRSLTRNPAPAPIEASHLNPTEPEVHHALIEDQSTRIEETRVRGQVQRITVTPKGSKAARYQIVPVDPSNSESVRGSPGQRVWNVLQF